MIPRPRVQARAQEAQRYFEGAPEIHEAREAGKGVAKLEACRRTIQDASEYSDDVSRSARKNGCVGMGAEAVGCRRSSWRILV